MCCSKRLSHDKARLYVIISLQACGALHILYDGISKLLMHDKDYHALMWILNVLFAYYFKVNENTFNMARTTKIEMHSNLSDECLMSH